MLQLRVTEINCKQHLPHQNFRHAVLLLQGEGSQRDYVIHVARTPEPVEDVADIESDKEAEEEDANKEMRSVPRPASLEDANELWVSTHAKQVMWLKLNECLAVPDE